MKLKIRIIKQFSVVSKFATSTSELLEATLKRLFGRKFILLISSSANFLLEDGSERVSS